ncbi:21799_t:CDS:2 [Rhizophagus irregularis]|nr:21799_t:CDS:2 [Rhizophagus irregularis]
MSDRSLPQRFRLPLPKPINDVIPYQQQTLNLHPAGKPMPNRREFEYNAGQIRWVPVFGVLNNSQKFGVKSFRYNSAQDEIKTLNDRIAMLEKGLQLASSRLIRSETIKNVNNRDPNTILW